MEDSGTRSRCCPRQDGKLRSTACWDENAAWTCSVRRFPWRQAFGIPVGPGPQSQSDPSTVHLGPQLCPRPAVFTAFSERSRLRQEQGVVGAGHACPTASLCCLWGPQSLQAHWPFVTLTRLFSRWGNKLGAGRRGWGGRVCPVSHGQLSFPGLC